MYGKELTIPLATTAYEMEESSDDGYTTEVVRRILAAKDQGLVSEHLVQKARSKNYGTLIQVQSQRFPGPPVFLSRRGLGATKVSTFTRNR